MRIILKYILNNIKEKKLRSLLIVFSLTLSVVILTLCLTLKDNVSEKFKEFITKSVGISDISITSDILFEKEKLENKDSNYSIAPYIPVAKEDKTIFGVDLETLQKNKIIKGIEVKSINQNEVIISEKRAKKDKLNIGDTLNILDSNYKIIDIADNYGMFLSETEEESVYITSIENVNKYFKNNLSDIEKQVMKIEEDKLYISGAYVDTLNDDTDTAKTYFKEIDNNFRVSKLLAGMDNAVDEINSLMILLLVVTILIAFYIISSILKLVLEERIAVIGTFRSIGASRRKTDFLLYLENTVYAIISSIVGIFVANIFMDKFVSSFINVGEVELTSKASIKFEYIAIVVVFTIAIQAFITFFELIKNKNKSIKNIIFDTQETKYKLKKRKVVVGFIFIVIAIILDCVNKNYNFIESLIADILIVIGFVFIIPMILKILSKILSYIFKNTSTFYLACKNVANNKIVISNTILLFIILLTTILISNISITVRDVYAGFDKVVHYTMRVENSENSEENYEYINNIEGVKKFAVEYCIYDSYMVNGQESFFAFVGYNKGTKVFEIHESVIFNKEQAEDLKDDEILLDEAFAIKNNYKIGDKIKFKNDRILKKQYEFTIKGVIDATQTTTMRTVGMITKNIFVEMFGENAKTLLIDSDLEDDILKEKLKNEIKEENIKFRTYKDWISSDKENTDQIMNIVYIILALGIALALIGLINNELISFGQRKRSFAVLNSTCMTKNQLYKMIFQENLISYLMAMIPAISLSYVMGSYIGKTLKGMNMFFELSWGTTETLILLTAIFVVVLIESIVPVRKIKKLNLVKEIKYE